MFIERAEFQAGFTARNADMSKDRNPYLHLGAPRRFWELGWQYADVLVNQELYNDESQLKRVDADPFEQGKNAYTSGLDRNECPYVYGDEFGTADEVATSKARKKWFSGYNEADRDAMIAIHNKRGGETDKTVSEITVQVNVETLINGKPVADFLRQFEAIFGKVQRDPNAV